MKKLWYIFRYKPKIKLVSVGVTIYFCLRITSIKVTKGCVFAPIRCYHEDNRLSYIELSEHIRKAKFYDKLVK